jgi:hypothetical protein
MIGSGKTGPEKLPDAMLYTLAGFSPLPLHSH